MELSVSVYTGVSVYVCVNVCVDVRGECADAALCAGVCT
jgi:hypothetical protein